jgi:hypothetical protein
VSAAAAPTGVWLVAGTPLSQPYPCRCRPGGGCSALWCPCAGRIDYAVLPDSCCAWVHRPAVAAAAQREYERTRSTR